MAKLKFGDIHNERVVRKRKLTNPKSRCGWNVDITFCKQCGNVTENDDRICDECSKKGD